MDTSTVIAAGGVVGAMTVNVVSICGVYYKLGRVEQQIKDHISTTD